MSSFGYDFKHMEMMFEMPPKEFDLEWINSCLRQPNRSRITTWPCVEEEQEKVFGRRSVPIEISLDFISNEEPLTPCSTPVVSVCVITPEKDSSTTSISGRGLPRPSRGVVDFAEDVTVHFFDQAEPCGSGGGFDSRLGRVKSFDGRSEVQRCKLASTPAALSEYMQSMSVRIQDDSSSLLEEEESMLSCPPFRRRRSYADHWDDLSRLVVDGTPNTSNVCGNDADVSDSMWLMEHMPCDCDL